MNFKNLKDVIVFRGLILLCFENEGVPTIITMPEKDGYTLLEHLSEIL